MQTILFYLVKGLISLIQALPLPLVAWLGRQGGGLAYLLDGRHRRVAIRNLTMCFGHEKSPAQIRALAKENFRRIGENYASALKTASMSDAELRPHLEIQVLPETLGMFLRPGENRMTVAIGHFGNFELYARCAGVGKDMAAATTYRGLNQPGLDRLLKDLRKQSGCYFFERRTEGAELKAFMSRPRLFLGLLADQSAGGNRMRLPFLGHLASTSSAPAVFALRYGCCLSTAICYRVSLARWRVEFGRIIPTHDASGPRSVEAIMTDVNQAFEAAIRRDPANWFWVHNRWKVPRQKAPAASPEREGTETA